MHSRRDLTQSKKFRVSVRTIHGSGAGIETRVEPSRVGSFQPGPRNEDPTGFPDELRPQRVAVGNRALGSARIDAADRVVVGRVVNLGFREGPIDRFDGTGPERSRPMAQWAMSL